LLLQVAVAEALLAQAAAAVLEAYFNFLHNH
jgi:hypothetical protein